MADTDIGGNAVDSPATDGTGQATPTMDQGADATATEPTDQSGQTAASSQTADTGKDQGDDTQKADTTDKPPPYDQDPKWKAARAAERRSNELLEKLGYDNLDDLETAAQEFGSLRGLIGNRDAEQLVQDAEELANIKAYWAEQEAAKREADEEPQETIARLKREKREAIEAANRERDDRAAIEEGQRIVAEFDSDTRIAVKSLDDLSDADRAMMVWAFGVDNEVASVDPTNKNAAKQAREAGIKRFHAYLKDVKEQAVEEYRSGKSEITTVSKSDTAVQTDSVTTEGKSFEPGTSVEKKDRVFKDRLLERLTKAQAV